MATDITPAQRVDSRYDDKHAIEVVEDVEGKVEQGEDVIMLSPFEDLSFAKTWVVFRKAALMSLFAAFSAAADGYQIAMTGTIIANKGFVLQFGTAKNASGAVILDASVLAAWGGIQSAGQGLGMLTQHFIADRFGRKKAFYTLWASLLIAVSLESFGKTWQTWLLAKLTSGFGVGSVQFMTGMYCTELAPSRIRGFILLFYSVWYGLGQMFASVCIKISNDRDPYNYLTPVYTEWAVLAVLLAVYIYIPESPFWCATRGRHEQGEQIMQRLNGGIEGYDVGFHYGIIRRTIEVERAHAKLVDGEEKGFLQELRNLKEVFVGSNGMRTFIAFWPAFTQQMTGLAVLSNYSSYFASVAGFTDAFMFSLLLSLVSLAATAIEAVLIDFVGRRMLFLGGIVATWMMLMVVGGLGLISDKSYSLNQLVLFFALVWRMASTLLGSLGWSFCAEAGTSRLRAKTSGVAAAGGVCTGLIFSTSVPYMLNANYANWGLKTCFFFAGLGFPLVVASFFVIPDTSRRTPAELDEMFKKGVKPWRFRKYVTDAQKALDSERLRTGETDPSKLQNKDRI